MLTFEDGYATIRLERAHGNAIGPELVRDLRAALAEAGADDRARGLMLAAAGKLFCPGLDLQVLIELDRVAMRRFMLDFGAAVAELYAFPRPVLAALHGHAVAGGCVLALTADWRVLSVDALIGLNEVRVGVPLPYGVAQILREAVAGPRLEEVALLGRNYRGREALEAGLVHEVHGAEGFEPHCRSRLLELLERDAHALATTKRYLRAAAVARIRAAEGRFVDEFLDGWFRPETRARIGAIVEELRGRG